MVHAHTMICVHMDLAVSVPKAEHSVFSCNMSQACHDSDIGLLALTGQMIFVRSYFDFVRLRNFLKDEGASFVGLCEYTKHSDVSRGRSNFFHGRRRIMLYTERAHFYHRYRLRGVKVGFLPGVSQYASCYTRVICVLLNGTAHIYAVWECCFCIVLHWLCCGDTCMTAYFVNLCTCHKL